MKTMLEFHLGRLASLMLCLCFVSVQIGCRSKMIAEEHARTGAQSFEKALQASEQGNQAAAIEQLNLVIANGGVSPDEMVEAYLMRIECQLALNNLAAAQADLAVVEQAYTDECRFLIVKGKVLLAAGDSTGAAQAFTQAKQIDPLAKTPM